MPADLYSKLSELPLLRRAWHLARKDSRSDFMFDSFRFADFAFRLEDYLKGLAQSLSNGAYHPAPLLHIDVPKSSLSVRPGTVLSIEDKIVLYAIACLIAPPLDSKLPQNVYSWRVKKNATGDELFHDHEILTIPFLKSRTIQRRIEFIEPWYATWPRFIQDLEYAFETEGYHYLVVADIVSYFENIDLSLLRDLFLRHLPHQPRLVNFLINLLEYWAWPAIHGAVAPRGIPQGNGVSSFLGNIYLLPLDQAFLSLCKRRDLKYLRYMDDVKVLAKDLSAAREALFLMNEQLRGLRLNIQGAKTRIFQGAEVREELFDDRLDEVNEIIKKIQIRSTLTPAARNRYVANLTQYVRSVKGKKGIVRDKELRLFRRLITGFTLLRHSAMVRLVLDQLERNPDSRLLNSANRYFRVQDRNIKRIGDRLFGFLLNEAGLFPYQRAHILMTLRYMRNLPGALWREARREATRKNQHWYVKQQAAVLLGLKTLQPRELRALGKICAAEEDTEIKRAWYKTLSQLPKEELEEVVRGLVFSADPKLQRLGHFYHGLLFEGLRGKEQVKLFFNDVNEEILLDRLHELEVLSKARDPDVRRRILAKMKKIKPQLRRPILKERIGRLVERLQRDGQVPA